jgi:hypothetical protein
MKVLNKDERKQVAVDIFARYPEAHKVAVAADGEAFIVDESENHARTHAKKNRYGKELELDFFTRDSLESAKTKTAESLIAAIKAAETIDAVNTILSEENAGKKRTSVLTAAEARLKELNAE